MSERSFPGNPDGQARAIIDAVRPGDIVLAHDVGSDRRLVALNGLAAMIKGLRERGFRFVTVSQMAALKAASSPES